MEPYSHRKARLTVAKNDYDKAHEEAMLQWALGNMSSPPIYCLPQEVASFFYDESDTADESPTDRDTVDPVNESKVALPPTNTANDGVSASNDAVVATKATVDAASTTCCEYDDVSAPTEQKRQAVTSKPASYFSDWDEDEERCPPILIVAVNDPYGSSQKYKIRNTTKMQKVFDDYTRRMGLEIALISFLHGSRRLRGEDTPRSLRLSDGDTIEFCFK